MKRAVLFFVVLAVLAGAYAIWVRPQGQEDAAAPAAGAALAAVTVPDSLSENGRIGERLFQAKCATCHGANAAGQQGIAPPLIHKIYEPSHHADESFHRAVTLGVRAHHWPFGDMPPVEGLSRGDVTMIVAYVREVQAANGIR
ncbi:c-type cytochrome [Ruegeria aquimaris]|uniref:Cytochrome c n=1 Tax=Ruegeria aquimaris TaxID=2984333 RepID=A0ABT3AF51_9RHOB|nr:cytochrome c [Ruegeria sp. XHP0148]MCV2887310.1 cytochrome c [Ruegeria sp. XHP0148]